MRGQQRITGRLRAHPAVAQDAVGEHREHGSTRGALETPDGDPTETDTHIMRVAGQAPTGVTGGLVFQLKAKGHHEGDDQCHTGLAVAKQLKVDTHGLTPVALAKEVFIYIEDCMPSNSL